MATLENKGAGIIRRIIREFINEERCFPRIEDLSDMMYDGICDSSYCRSESSAERMEDGMKDFIRKYDKMICKGSDDELFKFVNKELRISKSLTAELVNNRPEDLF